MKWHGPVIWYDSGFFDFIVNRQSSIWNMVCCPWSISDADTYDILPLCLQKVQNLKWKWMDRSQNSFNKSRKSRQMNRSPNESNEKKTAISTFNRNPPALTIGRAVFRAVGFSPGFSFWFSESDSEKRSGGTSSQSLSLAFSGATCVSVLDGRALTAVRISAGSLSLRNGHPRLQEIFVTMAACDITSQKRTRTFHTQVNGRNVHTRLTQKCNRNKCPNVTWQLVSHRIKWNRNHESYQIIYWNHIITSYLTQISDLSFIMSTLYIISYCHIVLCCCHGTGRILTCNWYSKLKTESE